MSYRKLGSKLGYSFLAVGVCMLTLLSKGAADSFGFLAAKMQKFVVSGNAQLLKLEAGE